VPPSPCRSPIVTIRPTPSRLRTSSRGTDGSPLFSHDACCQGVDSTYNIAVGRSASVTGPYLDADGVSLLDDGVTPLLTTDGSMIGPGGQSVADDVLAFHFYDETLGGDFTLGLRELVWTADGWPVARTAAELAAASSR
jgi:arabinan endo-1,5-alpha-L-arabinosidase